MLSLKLTFALRSLRRQCLLSVRQTAAEKSECLPSMAREHPDGLPWGLLPSRGPTGPLRVDEGAKTEGTWRQVIHK